jgi:type IV pilus assembly protein PilE
MDPKVQKINKQTGFTLIELMITVAIVAILTSLAVPSYRNYVMRGRIPDGTSNLALKRTQAEQWFLDNQTYATAPACNLDQNTSQFFDFSCAASTATTYTLQAVGKGGMAGFTFTIDQSNTKATTAAPAGWTTNAACWIVRSSGACS